ncbi:MAG: hypothetical protein MJ137_08440 [Clostridia bacterium]|nr:hypothetical protein [Clostridia bacterium]
MQSDDGGKKTPKKGCKKGAFFLFFEKVPDDFRKIGVFVEKSIWFSGNRYEYQIAGKMQRRDKIRGKKLKKAARKGERPEKMKEDGIGTSVNGRLRQLAFSQLLRNIGLSAVIIGDLFKRKSGVLFFSVAYS